MNRVNEYDTGGRFAASGGLFAGGPFAGGPFAGGLLASGLNHMSHKSAGSNSPELIICKCDSVISNRPCDISAL